MVTSGGALVVSSKEGGKTKNRRGEGDLLRTLHEKSCMIDRKFLRKNLPIRKEVI